MPALVQLRAAPGILDATLRRRRVRIYAAEPEKLLEEWNMAWPWPELNKIGYRWTEPDMEDVFKAYSQGYFDMLTTKGCAV